MKIFFLIMIGISFLQAEFIRTDINATAGVVLDTTTNLMWQDDNEAKSITQTWSNAISYCENKTLGGYDDWRLANFNELYMLADRSQYQPALSSVFQNLDNVTYWTSTTYAGDTSYAWGVYFYDGDDGWHDKTDTFYVRCVR